MCAHIYSDLRRSRCPIAAAVVVVTVNTVEVFLTMDIITAIAKAIYYRRLANNFSIIIIVTIASICRCFNCCCCPCPHQHPPRGYAVYWWWLMLWWPLVLQVGLIDDVRSGRREDGLCQFNRVEGVQPTEVPTHKKEESHVGNI